MARKSRKRRGANDDLLEPFRVAAREAAERIRGGEQGVEISVKGPLILDQGEAETAPLTIASLIVERIKQDLGETNFSPSEATSKRRERAQKTPQVENGVPRYPAGFSPRPDGAYGDDSGYLRTALSVNISDNKKDVFAGIPKNRQKSGFIIRRVSPTAGTELPAAVARTATELIRTIVRKTIAKAVRKEMKGTGARIALK